LLGAGAQAVLWYDGVQAEAHQELEQEIHAANVDLDLRLVESELKHLRDLAERRPLTADEQDRKRYLEERRRILTEEQQRKKA
jgi:hypothetical protein